MIVSVGKNLIIGICFKIYLNNPKQSTVLSHRCESIPNTINVRHTLLIFLNNIKKTISSYLTVHLY